MLIPPPEPTDPPTEEPESLSTPPTGAPMLIPPPEPTEPPTNEPESLSTPPTGAPMLIPPPEPTDPPTEERPGDCLVTVPGPLGSTTLVCNCYYRNEDTCVLDAGGSWTVECGIECRTTAAPTAAPTTSPTTSPTKSPTMSPTAAPTAAPMLIPPPEPTDQPTAFGACFVPGFGCQCSYSKNSCFVVRGTVVITGTWTNTCGIQCNAP